ncbi:hypothetical protein SAMN05216418_0107 [Microbacterium enclense]|uniref:Lipoprotein n=1 Tax=Microbacterium enclense TaxID=993073 RepID=A0A1G6REK1_9MICO|nr:hypothetical protein SAMN05216418_0107 [Microbacterium enclense]
MVRLGTSSRGTAGAVLAIASVLALTSCAATPAPVDAADRGAAVSTEAPTPVESATPESDHDESIPHDHDVEVDPNADADVTELATRAVTLFCRPSLAYATWIAELYPVLSQSAAVAYETVDPANVPCTSVTDAARIRDMDGAYTARVLVPTDAGDYSVYVHRPLDTAPWAVEQITPLASE